MNEATQLFHQYGVPAIALIVFVKRMGVPVPAMPFLLLAGARGVDEPLFAVTAALAACAAAVVGDALWFEAGRRYGRGMLGLMCRISVSPDICIRRSELAFARQGAAAVLVAKFIPGLAGLAPPLAGALRMPAGRFTAINLAGTLLWVGFGVVAGWLLHRQVGQLVALLDELGRVAWPLLGIAVAGYVAWLLARRGVLRRAALRTPRLAPRQVAERMARGEPFVFVDVRGPKASLQKHIGNAIHGFLDSELQGELDAVDQSVHLVVYCDCPDDVSAARVAEMLVRRGRPAHVLAGGFSAWVAAGLPVESTAAGKNGAAPGLAEVRLSVR